MFMNAIKNELNNEKQLTENGAVGFRSTGKKLLDLNFSVASLRNASEQTIIDKFMDAYWEDPVMGIKWLFYSRDARQGLGERRLFRIVLKHLAQNHSEIVLKLIPLIAEYGRWDDLYCLVDTPLEGSMFAVMKEQFYKDIKVVENDTKTKWKNCV